MDKTKPATMRVLDTFSGAGGFSLGFEMAGCEIVGAVESDRWACDTFGFNHPGATVVHGDITKISDEQFRTAFDGARRPDIVIGGPPCQGFSIANRSAGDPKDPRNSLFKEFVRVGLVFQPQAMVMENVPNLLAAKTAEGRKVIEIIVEALEEIGYHVYWKTLEATDFGVPQKRTRLFVVASMHALERPFPEPTHRIRPDNSTGDLYDQDLLDCPTLWDAISDMPELGAGDGGEEVAYTKPPQTDYQKMLRGSSEILFNHKAMNHTPRMVERFSHMEWGHSVSDVPEHLKPRKRNSQEIGAAYDQNNRRMFPHKQCNTVPASFYANFVHPYQHRNFTAREGARIQSFPDSFKFLGKPTVVSHMLLAREGREGEKFLCQYNQIGNAVPPLLSKAVAHNLIVQLHKHRENNNARARKQSSAERIARDEVSG